eukprot:COSAG02_NODE_1333_length_13206_cov_221.257801_4_plen_51_part_00
MEGNGHQANGRLVECRVLHCSMAITPRIVPKSRDARRETRTQNDATMVPL